MKLAQKAFGDWKAEGAGLADTAPEPTTAKPMRLLLECAGSVQSTIRLGSHGIAASANELLPMRLTRTGARGNRSDLASVT